MDYEEADKSALRQHGVPVPETFSDGSLPGPAGPPLGQIGDSIRELNDQAFEDRLMNESDKSKKARLAKKWVVLCKVLEVSAEVEPVEILEKVYNRGVSDTNEAFHKELEKRNFWQKKAGQ